MKKKQCSTIGGQAVIEGVMMRGQRSMATAVRDEKGNIVVESKNIKPTKEKNFLFRTPFLRGIFNFIATMIEGMATLLRSGEVFDGESEPGKFESWLAKKTKINLYSIIMTFAVLVGIGLSIGLFFFLPNVITQGIVKLAKIDLDTLETGAKIGINLIEGCVRMTIFIAYISLTSLMKDVRRTYMYHGAEHKTISCYEHGLDLTVENAQTMTTIHDRCGTTFMFFIMVVSVLVFSLTGWSSNFFINLGLRLLLLPVISGVSYELLKFLAKFDNKFVKILKAPGLWLQKLTTKKPTDEMVEVAITAFNVVMAMDADSTIQPQYFDTKVLYGKVRIEIDNILAKVNAEKSDGDWIICEATGLKRQDLEKISHIRKSQADKAKDFANKRAEGIPLWQVFGQANFYGYDIIISDKVLCPRPETEYLAEQVIQNSKDSDKILDMCCGSGCISVAVAMQANVTITACDISQEALEICAKNIEKHNLQEKIKTCQTNMFENVEGKFNIIVSNPPYIPTADIQSLDIEVRLCEPHIALDGGVDGLHFYKILLEQSPQFLVDNGMLAMECGINQAEQIVAMAEEKYNCKVIKDLQGIDRIIIASLK